jgi:hypothetical protein
MINELSGIRRSPSKQQVKGYQLQKTCLVVWLGNSEKDQEHSSLTIRLAMGRSGLDRDKGTSDGRTDQDAYEAIYDAILLFDAAVEQFDSERDQQVRKVIEHLALDVLSRFRLYAMTRASDRPRTVSKEARR